MSRIAAVALMRLLIVSLIVGKRGSKIVFPRRQEDSQSDKLDHSDGGSCSNKSSSCAPWSYCDASQNICKCVKVEGDMIVCKENENLGNILTPYVLDCNCITTSEVNETKALEVGKCDYNCAKNQNNVDIIYQKLPPNISDWNAFMCAEFKRSGTLCGKCDEERNYYPRVYSFDMSCIQCDHSRSNWWKYILLAYVPLTVFYLIVFILKVDIHSSQLQGFIIFSQFISIPALARNLLLSVRSKPKIFDMVKFIGAIYGIWNLDFFRTYSLNLCFRMSSLAALSLDLAVAVYPLFLIIVSYIVVTLHDRRYKLLTYLWKPFKKLLSKWQRNFEIRTSSVNAFAAFLFLSNTKFFSICFDILTPVEVYQFYNQHFNSTWRLYYNPNVKYFSAEHRWYALTAILITFVLVIVPVLILLLYSTRIFHKFLSLLPHRWQLFLHVFVDSFQGCYKDGTEPATRDCRWYAPTFYLSRLLLMVIYGLSLNAVFFPLGAMVLTIIALVTIYVDPFKSNLRHLSSSMVIFILLTACFYVSAIGAVMAEESSNAANTYMFYMLTVAMSLLPLVYIAIIAIKWMNSHFNMCNKFREIQQ